MSSRAVGSGAILGLGTAVFVPSYGVGGAGLTVDDPRALFREAIARGVRYVDTASGYGTSEDWLGEVSELLTSMRVRICTKLPARDLPNGLAESLRRLRRDSIDTLLLHGASAPELRDPATAGALRNARTVGQAYRLGASTYGAADACFALEQEWCNAVQVEFSILNPSVVRAARGSRRSGQEIVARSVLTQGLLTARRGQAAHVSRPAMAVLDALDRRANEWGFSLEELAIRFALDTPGIDVVLVGIRNVAELGAAMDAFARRPLEPHQLDALQEFDHSSEDWTHPERWVVNA